MQTKVTIFLVNLKSVKNANKSDNFSRQFEVCQNNANKSDNFSRQFEVCQNTVTIFLVKLQNLPKRPMCM